MGVQSSGPCNMDIAQFLVVLLVSCSSGQYGDQGRPGYGQDQCVVDNIQKYGDVCIPTLHTNCEKESTRNGIQIETDEECYKVVKTVCKEDSEVVNMRSVLLTMNRRELMLRLRLLLQSLRKCAKMNRFV